MGWNRTFANVKPYFTGLLCAKSIEFWYITAGLMDFRLLNPLAHVNPYHTLHEPYKTRKQKKINHFLFIQSASYVRTAIQSKRLLTSTF